MPARPITELKNRHRGEDAWILASGPSMAFFDPQFFAGRLTFGVNHVHRHFPCRYVVGKELPQEVLDDRRHTLIVSRHPCGNTGWNETQYAGPHDWYRFDHGMNNHTHVDWSVLGTDRIVVSYSTITSAMHVAAYLGAANLILCGTDGGTLDGRTNYPGYRDGDNEAQHDWYRQFVREIEPQTLELRDRLHAVYGCRTYMLNPFVNLHLEGHTLER